MIKKSLLMVGIAIVLSGCEKSILSSDVEWNGEGDNEKAFYKGTDKLVTGKIEEFDDEGNLTRVVHTKDGILNGTLLIYKDGATLRDLNFKNGKIDGLNKFYNYDNGNLVAEDNYKNGELDGISKKYSDNELRLEMNFKNGELDGVFKVFEDSRVEYIGNYKNGEVINCFKQNYNSSWKLEGETKVSDYHCNISKEMLSEWNFK